MLWPTHTCSVSRPGATSPYVTGREIKFHTPHIDTDITVHPVGQPVHTFLEDNGTPALAWARGDIVSDIARKDGQPYTSNITKWTVDDWRDRGDIWKYMEVQLTGTGR